MSDRPRILLIEPQKPARANLLETLKGLGYLVSDVATQAEATEVVDQLMPTVVIASSAAVSEDFCRYVRMESEAQSGVVLIFPRGAERAVELAEELGADAGFAKPVSRDLFHMALRLAERVSEARRRAAQLQGRADELGERLERMGDVRPGQRFYHFDFFKHLLIVEIRRAKRYRYPLSVCLLEIDPYRLPPGHLMARREIRSGVARAVSESIRDIDIPVYVGGERILIVLPHTPIAGAGKVARRVARLIREGMYHVGDELQSVSASIGVAGLEGAPQATFSELIRRAQVALKTAQEKGGDQVATDG
ncbi:MAG: diguanylate cyclase [Polyangia bacterium]|jgi:diguanylate cyclase (GGDEF)-like protein|nr:diguanylate cyclase [Polyangia bacterium]